jgi:hypothetical protein
MNNVGLDQVPRIDGAVPGKKEGAASSGAQFRRGEDEMQRRDYKRREEGRRVSQDRCRQWFRGDTIPFIIGDIVRVKIS